MRTLIRVVTVVLFVALVFTVSGCCPFNKGGGCGGKGNCGVSSEQTPGNGCGQGQGCQDGAEKCGK